MEGLHDLRAELSKVRVQLDNIEAELAKAGDNIPYKISLRNEKAVLVPRLDKLENVIQALTTSAPVPTPAPAPPGNSITLPQVLPLASFLSSPSFFRIRFVNRFN